MGGLLADGVPPRRSPVKAKGPLPPQQAFFLFGGCLRKERFFRHTAQERRDNTPPPPRTCAGDSMSTSEASCHRRDLSRAATRRELPGVQPPRSDSGGTPLADEKTETFTFAPFLPLPFLHPSPADRRPSGPGCGAPPRASPHTSPAAPGFSAAAAGETSGYTP